MTPASGSRSAPPTLPGYRHKEWLGGGGFADVFLYDQLRPVREVAVKVLRESNLDQEALSRFDAEADLMARVSSHPYIVTIFGADVAPDGRPYLVMEYYPHPHFGEQVKRSPLRVAEVLELGVRLASAVETAHRAGIVHRDIKPANILVSQYRRPGLSDFGIAGARLGDGFGVTQGVSVPYAPPEVLTEESPGDERSDVYSLAATLYALLVGRSPFESTSSSNASHEVVQRALSCPIPVIGRDDVPPSLAHLLAQAMAKRPADRPGSAAEMARSLQDIEGELGFNPTPFEVSGTDIAERAAERPTERPTEDERTRARGVQVVRQDEVVPPPPGRQELRPVAGRAPVASVPEMLPVGPGPALDLAGPARLVPAGGRVVPPAADTVARRAPVELPHPAPPPDSPPATKATRLPRLAIVGAGAVLVLIAIVALSVVGGKSTKGTTTTDTTSATTDTTAVFGPAPRPPTSVTVTMEGDTAKVAFTPEAPAPGDTFRVVRTDPAGLGDEPIDVPAPPGLIPGVATGTKPCVTVSTQRGARQSDPSPVSCLP